jgi:crotonobetainyl-CoA:carnitine CoA-transferase CaiB-like acyl-CoA transferase
MSTPKDLLEDAQLAARDYFVPVAHPELDDVITYPGAPFKMSRTPLKISRRAPLIGEHNEEIYEKELGFSKEELNKLKATGVI